MISRRRILMNIKTFLILSITIFTTANAQPADTAYVFYVEMVAKNPNLLYPHDSIPDSSFKHPDTLISYPVRFSSVKDSVFVGTWKGVKSSTSAGIIHYTIINMMAGGYFSLWYNTVPYQAELTMYGSGVPIIFRERGHLISSSVKTRGPIHSPQQGFGIKPGIKGEISVDGRILKTFHKSPLVSKKCRNFLLCF
jgi:hypothetical protein